MTNDYLRPLSMHFPGKLVFGNGSLSDLPAEVAATGSKKAFVITIEPLLTALQSFFDELKSSGIAVSVNTGITQEPYYSDFEKLLTEAETINPDIIIGIGGGSVLDVAKLIAALTGNRQPLNTIAGIGLLKSRSKKLVCLPATSGTGSEVSPNAILIDDADGQKKGIISPHLVPDMVYVDPLLTISVPPAITAATGLDALTHCLEAYTNKFALPFIDMYAYEGIRLIAANLVKAVKNGSDEQARSQIAMGSLLGGFCLGPVNTAGVHALSYPLGSMFHLAHGLSNALLLPYVMEFNLPAAPARYANVAVALGCKREGNDVETAEKGIEKIRQLINECGVPPRLRDVGVQKESLPAMAKDAMKIQRLLKNNPREISEKDAIHIYNEAY
ncbi:MAG TPA: iron-containing alcohol dehydrogenase [Mucilaginibacter sp.]|nr:iron-containing alcohol dehydrogenase [Mucilaginibacter sp.]